MQRQSAQDVLNPTLIYTRRGFLQVCETLRARATFALDTESDSLYSYYPKVCLIQITTFADEEVEDPARVVDFLLDPLRLERLDELNELLADPTRQVIMHAAENDMLLLYRDFHFAFSNVFDTQLAARILGWQGVGLANLLEGRFGLVSDKRMQRTNWGARPLTPQQIAYAQMDTHYLPALRAVQLEELAQQARMEEAQDAFRLLTQTDYAGRMANERTVWSMKSARSVPRESTGVLASLWEWREAEAQRQNRPPFKVATDGALVQMAEVQPQTVDDLYEINDLSAHQVQRYGEALMAALLVGATRPLPPLPDAHERPEAQLNGSAQLRYETLRRWRTKQAEQRGVGTDIIFTNSTLIEIARRAPRSLDELAAIPELGPWKLKTYGPELLRLVDGKVK